MIECNLRSLLLLNNFTAVGRTPYVLYFSTVHCINRTPYGLCTLLFINILWLVDYPVIKDLNLDRLKKVSLSSCTAEGARPPSGSWPLWAKRGESNRTASLLEPSLWLLALWEEGDSDRPYVFSSVYVFATLLSVRCTCLRISFSRPTAFFHFVS